MAWRLARSLTVLRDQLNAAHPRRSKASDGTIGDASHSSRTSDHNPNDAGVVCAMDITHDPANGVDCNVLADAFKGHPAVKYLIWNRHIADYRPAYGSWTWRPYTGTNPHTKHLHVSVRADRYDHTDGWPVGAEEDDFMSALNDDQQRYLYNAVAQIREQLTGSQDLAKFPGFINLPQRAPGTGTLAEQVSNIHRESMQRLPSRSRNAVPDPKTGKVTEDTVLGWAINADARADEARVAAEKAAAETTALRSDVSKLTALVQQLVTAKES